MRGLLRGRLGRAGYCRLLRNLQAIYAALEAALERHATHPFVAALDLPGLRRCAALAADLRALHGERWEAELGIAAATARYAARLRELDRDRPELLVAHAYVRYLGDLSGGQILRRTVADALGLAPGAGATFYDFGCDPAALAGRFRARLDSLGADPATADAIVAEAQHAFDLHVRLFEELASPPSRAGSHSSAP
jgi:heme oxygenase